MTESFQDENQADDEFTHEELAYAKAFLKGLFLFFNLFLIGVTIWLGYKSWLWYIVIPVVGIAFAFLRVLKRSLTNLIDAETENLSFLETVRNYSPIGFLIPKTAAQSLQDEEPAEPLPSIGFAIPGATPTESLEVNEEDNIPAKRSNRSHIIITMQKIGIGLIILIFILLVPAFWYGLGLIASLGFH